MKAHELRTKTDSFEAIWRGAKRAIFRLDGQFQVGDELRLLEWDPQQGLTGRQIRAEITHVEDCSGPISGGGDPSWIMLSLSVTEKGDGAPETED